MMPGSAARTLLVAGGVALFCSVIVSLAVTYLRPIQLAWAELGRSRMVLELAGLVDEGAELSGREVASRFRDLDTVLVDLESGRLDDTYEPIGFKPRDSRVLAADGEDIPDSLDLARIGRRARLAPAFLHFENGRLLAVILPLWGQGMWAPIQAYIALDGNCQTVLGLDILEHGETPGIGDRIEKPEWRTSWRGLMVADETGQVLLRPKGSEGSAPDGRHTFDAITGATVTVTAFGRIVRYWLGPHGFGPFLERCRAGELSPS
jgi:Na+-transporting NADH:ubiquinone oxidoreductase subunit C